MTGTSPRRAQAWVIATGIYLVLIVLASFSLWQARQWALREFQEATSDSAWDEWRQSSQSEDSDRPPVVQRRPVETREPPTLALLRDHFTACWVGVIGLGSIVYWTTTWLLFGAFGAAPIRADSADATQE